MVKQHLKRIFMPKTWQIQRKSNVFISRPKPGAHELKYGVSLNTFFKEMLKYCKTTKEVRQILLNKEVLVDGKRRKNERYLVGLMDVVSIPSINENFRILLSSKGNISYIKIDDKEAKFKPSKISGKTIIKGGKFQLNFTDGRNILIDKNDYKVGDTLMLEVPSQKIGKHFKLDVGSTVILTGGSHIGNHGELKTIVGKVITFVTPKGVELETKIEHAFVIGGKKPEIKVEE